MKIASYSIFGEYKSSLPFDRSFNDLVIEGVEKGFSLFLYEGELYFIGKTERYYTHELLNVDFEL